MMYKSTKKIDNEIDFNEGVLDTAEHSLKDCDYHIARAKTTRERIVWEVRRSKWEKRQLRSKKNIEKLYRHSNIGFYVFIVLFVASLLTLIYLK